MNSKRIDELEIGLSPKQAVIGFMEEIHRYDSMQEYWASVSKQPFESPRSELLDQVEKAAKWRIKKQNGGTATNSRTQRYRERIASDTTYKSVREAVFLYFLMLHINKTYAEESRVNHLLIALVREQLCRLFDYVYGREFDDCHELATEFLWNKNRTANWTNSLRTLSRKLYEFSISQ